MSLRKMSQWSNGALVRSAGGYTDRFDNHQSVDGKDTTITCPDSDEHGTAERGSEGGAKVMIQHAILYESAGLYYVYLGGECYRTEIIDNVEQLLPVFETHNIDVLWCMPGTPLSRFVTWADFATIDQELCKVFPEPPKDLNERPTFVSIRRKSNDKFERDRYIGFPAHGEWSANDQGQWFMPAPYALGWTINYLSREFQCDVKWGPGNIGMQVLKRSFAKKGLKFDNTIMTDQLQEIINRSMFRPIWKRYEGLSEEQKSKKYLHGYDKNAQYLGAAQSAYLGKGTPVSASETNLSLIGFWKYRITDVSNTAFDGYELPCPLDVNREWASSDLLMAARYAGVEFDVLEGLVWPDGAKFMADWAMGMWKHRANLRDRAKYPNEIARENAVGTAKAAANMMMGRLARPGSRELYKPDWNQLIVHRAITNMMYSLNKWQRDHNIRPVLVSTDSFWIVSDEYDESMAIPGILEHTDEQRGYKHIGTLEMSYEIIELFNCQAPETINRYLKEEIENIVQSV